MDTANAVLIIILTPTLIVGLIGYLFKGIFQQLLSRDIENHKQNLARDTEKYKTQLQYETEISKLRLQNDLNVELFKYQTQFSLIHSKQAEVIGETYGLLFDAKQSLSALVSPLQTGDDDSIEHAKETVDKFNSLVLYFNKNRIYIDEPTCEKMDTLIKILRHCLQSRTFIYDNHIEKTEARKLWHQAWRTMEEEVPPIDIALQQQFRKLLSVESTVKEDKSPAQNNTNNSLDTSL